ncbi:MAG TPA: helix-turn-helix transcriptional regulator [Pseudonocardiaceae bacterium]|nr:helix-turn-helix transcriptional regulator [Pseudonocardiaceae bacterium]
MATATRLKKQLGAALRHTRERAELTAKHAADELRAVQTTVNRYESGETLPGWPTLRTLLTAYDADAEETKRITQLWEAAREEAPPVRLPMGTSRTFRRYVTAEREAVGERGIEPVTVPGLLQTERYARAINDRGIRYLRQTARPEGYVNIRRTRQTLLDGPTPLNLHVIVDEAALHREIGGREVMHEQFAHLLVVAEWSNITIQVMPYGVGAYGFMSGAVAIIDYAEPDSSPGVYLEYPAGGAWVENPEDVGRFTTMFEDAASAALTPDETVDLIHQRMRSKQ